MATTPFTQEQIRRNAMEDAREYHEECSDNLTNDYQRGFRIATGHGAMIGHWSSMFTTPLSEVLTAFASTPSIAFPALLNLPPPPIPEDTPVVHENDQLDEDWEIESQTFTPPLPVPPPLPHFPNDIIGPNPEPITPTPPPPSFPSSPRPPSLTPLPMTPPPLFDLAVNTLIQFDTEAAIEAAVQAEEERQRTPSPTGPQPNVHPGPGWSVNFEDPGVRYAFQIPTTDGRREVAPFIQIDWNTTSPELLGTLGRSCPVYSRGLHARADDVPRPSFDRRQEFFFAEGQTHSEGVDWALQQENDDTLWAEVIRNRAVRAQVTRRARQLADLREQLADDRFRLGQSTRHLARANAYRRLRRHITHTLTPTTLFLNSRHITRIQEAVDSPWNWTDERLSDQCSWCMREGHRVESCALIRVCQLCNCRGHLEEDCFQPHLRCVSFQPCRVPLTHQYRRLRACPSVVVLERNKGP